MAEHPDVALVRKGYEAFSNGDFDTLSQLLSPEAVQHVPGNNLISGDYKGQDAIFGMYKKLFELTNGDLSVRVESILTDGKGTVVAVHRSRATRNGETADEPAAIIFTIRDGKAVDLHEVIADIEEGDKFWS